MAVRPLCLFPNPLLSTPAKNVADFGNELHQLVTDLRDTLYKSPGVGLAAPQIGVSLRVSVIDISRRKSSKAKPAAPNHGLITLVNPVLLKAQGRQIPREGCLSVPDFLADIRRYEQVTVQAQNENGEEFILTSTGFEALAVQHEMDHLDGKLFLDRVSNLNTDLFRRKSYS